MARRRYFRYYPRTRAAKKKWASHLKQGQIAANNSFGYQILCENAISTNTPVPTIIKVGNVKVQGDGFCQGVTVNTSMTLFVMYIPEGFSADSDTPREHPEWIMAWKQIDLATTNQASSEVNSFSVSSRLKRNLNSGDKVIVGVYTSAQCAINYTCMYYTCAN